MIAPFGAGAVGALIAAGAVFVLGCAVPSPREAPVSESLRDVPDSLWARLGAQRIFFGHQSVGGNIMDGVAEVAREHPRFGLHVRVDEDVAASGPAFTHALIGRNGDPGLKTDAFARRIESEGGRVDIAFHKYCYADLYDTTDVAAVFEHYRQTMSRLHAEFPGILFVHVTSPIQRPRGGPKEMLKQWLGRSSRVADNRARHRFNELMRRTYGGREPLFDLAALEATRPDGTREVVRAAGGSVPALVAEYTSDGSHLNETGRRLVAERLLVFLAHEAEAHREAARP